jgi:hypothetical protein
MSEIKINILEVLDGKKPYMGMLFIDSYGDKLLKTLKLADIDPKNPDGDHFDNYFTVCTKCQLPVVDSSIMPDTQGMCDHCYTAGPLSDEAMLNMVRTQTLPEDIMLSKEGFKSVEERIGSAIYMASDQFWKTIADLFPECKTGDLEPLYVFKMEETMKETVTHWVENNSPKVDQSYRGDGVEELDALNLHYRSTWHLMHTGGGCMVALTDNVAVAGNHNYMGVTGDCICIYTDTFNQDDFLMEPIATWTFGDNPTVLMNQIDDFMGGVGYWDTGKLFDDIMTLAKSNLTM